MGLSPRLRLPVLATAAALLLLLALVLRPDRRTAWEQAALTRDRPVPMDPVTLSLWANHLSPLLHEGEALGPAPIGRESLLRWLDAQCGINRRIQELQRRYGKPVDPEERLGRGPFCRDLELVKQRIGPP